MAECALDLAGIFSFTYIPFNKEMLQWKKPTLQPNESPAVLKHAVASTRVLCLSPVELQGFTIPSDGVTTIAVAGGAGRSTKSSRSLATSVQVEPPAA